VFGAKNTEAMGILGLSKLIADIAPIAVKESEIKHYFGMYVIPLFDLLQCQVVCLMGICVLLLRSESSN